MSRRRPLACAVAVVVVPGSRLPCRPPPDGRAAITDGGPAGMADLHRLGRARGPGHYSAGPGPGRRLHPGASAGVGCQAGGRRRRVPADGPRARRARSTSRSTRHRPGRRRDADVQGRRRRHLSPQRRAASGRSRSTASSSPATVSTPRAPTTWTSTGKDVRGAAVVWLGADGPKALDAQAYRACSRAAAAATRRSSCALRPSIGPRAAASAGADARRRPRRLRRGGQARPTPDFTTAQRLDAPVAPAITASDAFFEFLFSQAPVRTES